MLRGGLPRAVVRVSNTQVTCQLVSYEPEGDRVLESITGKSLVDSHKWPSDASRKSVPACYLAGFAMATSAISNGHSKAILDIGLAASSTGNRAYSALKGMIDAGMEIPIPKNNFHNLFTKAREVIGLSLETIQFAKSSLFALSPLC